MKTRNISIVTGSIILALLLGIIVSIPVDAETGSITISSGSEDGYEEYLGANSDPSFYWRVHYDWTITSGDPSNVRFSITDFYGDSYGGSSGEYSGDSFIQVTEGSYYFSWINSGDSSITVEYDIWYEEVSPFDDGGSSPVDDFESTDVGCCGGFMIAGILALAGSFFVIGYAKKRNR